jgi:hypothetical protein
MFKKLLFTMLVALALVSGALVSLPGVTQAQPAYDFEVTSPAITGPVTIQPFQAFVVTATGFSPGESGEIYLQRSGQAAPGTRLTAANATANGSGALTHTVTLPSNIPYGSVYLRARNAQLSVNAIYTATVNPAIVLSISSGAPGSAVTIRGFGFAASEAYTVTFVSEVDDTRITAGCVATTTTVTEVLKVGSTTSATGGFSFNTTVPSVDPDTYKIVAVGHTSAVCTQ